VSRTLLRDGHLSFVFVAADSPFSRALLPLNLFAPCPRRGLAFVGPTFPLFLRSRRSVSGRWAAAFEFVRALSVPCLRLCRAHLSGSQGLYLQTLS